jgi:hypothetical protein
MKMGTKYGIIQKANASCVLYKEDQDGFQSFFTALHPTKKDHTDKKNIVVFIDNEVESIANVFLDNILTPENLLKIFDEWAADAPVLFQMEAYSLLLSCCSPQTSS